MPKDFLLEVGTEPLPARFIAPAAAQLSRLLQDELKTLRFSFGEARVYATPRRLAVVLSALSEKSTPVEVVDFGPPADRAKDSQGRWTPAAEGFARKFGVEPGALGVETGPKGGPQLAFRRTLPGETAEAALKRALPALLAKLDFPKSLEWEPTRFRFGRPIRSLAALHGARVVKFEVAGVKSGDRVFGLAALGQKPIKVASPAKYAGALRDALVLADVSARREALEKKLLDAARKAGARVDLDEDLVDETVYMTEQPSPVHGSFSPDFLSLPPQLLALVLKKQLKFFPLYEGSRLQAGFLGVRDGVSEGQQLVREGYERVLVARLSDAVFFFGRDRAAPLASRLPMLGRVTYQKALGSMADKKDRVCKLAAALAALVGENVKAHAAAEIAELCYADLVTDVVREFPELQGVMGGVYARLEGKDERVALGVEEFYLPLGPKSPVPTTIEGAVASLAGKLDSLAGNFVIGQIPTGSADPFALRRQALGAIRIVLEKQLPLDIKEVIRAAIDLQPVEGDRDKAAKQLEDFLWGRAQSFFEEKGFRVDEIRAVSAGGLADLRRTYLRLCAVRDVRKHPDFEPLAAAYKRAANILKQAKVRPGDTAPPERAGLKEQAELSLFDKLSDMEGEFREKLSQDGYEAGLRALVAVKPELDLFFEKVMVMAEDEGLRRQRLVLLAKLVRLFSSVADLSELQPASAN